MYLAIEMRTPSPSWKRWLHHIHARCASVRIVAPPHGQRAAGPLKRDRAAGDRIFVQQDCDELGGNHAGAMNKGHAPVKTKRRAKPSPRVRPQYSMTSLDKPY